MNTADSSINAASEPRSGTSNTNTASAAAPSVDTIPSAKYGSSFPTRLSTTEAGVDITASIVPRSHSRAATTAVRMVPMMVIMMANATGTSESSVTSSGLKQYQKHETHGQGEHETISGRLGRNAY